MKRFHIQREDLAQLTLNLRRAQEQAEAKVASVNQLIQQFAATGMLAETVILGDVLQTRAYAPRCGGNSSGQLVQAVLLVPGGFGVSVWDTEEYLEAKHINSIASETPVHFVPFSECCPAWKALLLPHVEPLFEKLAAELT
jgi:hypothetical protein